nr:hypothetical protein [uncultured Sphaerochaeta sp.]
MIQPCAPLLDEGIVDRCKKLGVSLLLDGVKAANLDLPNGGCMDATVNAVERGMFVVGTALTVETQDGDNFPIHVASYSQPGDGYVMVIDGKGYKQRSYCGDLIMGACQVAALKG